MDTPEAAPRKQVLTDFMARNPDVTIDVRALPSDIQWDRVARTTVSAGEQVDLLNINGLFIRAWVRDNLLADLSTHSQLNGSFRNVEPSFLAAQSDDPRHPFAVPVIHASPVHPAGEASWNPLLVMWIQPMLVNNQPMEFTQKALPGDGKYNGPEWIKTFETIANLSRDGVLAPGSGALGVDAAYQLFNQGKAAMLLPCCHRWWCSRSCSGTLSRG
jgi:ABC-type glycerol-3-phosphate transport system substrate-binding protein